jgi:hypothetical protein
LAHHVHPAKKELGDRIALLRQWGKFLERSRVILLLISPRAGLISAPTERLAQISKVKVAKSCRDKPIIVFPRSYPPRSAG